jgi:putative protease
MNINDEILIIGPTTGVLELTISELHNDYGKTDKVNKGEHFSISVPTKVRKNDKIYKVINNV